MIMRLKRFFVLCLSLPSLACLAADQVPSVVQAATIQVGDQVVLKGLAVQAGEEGDATFCYDTETMRLAGVWRGGFINPIRLMSRGDFPVAQGEIELSSDARPGAVIGDELGDPREQPFGPVAAEKIRYNGFHRFENRITLNYNAGGVGILEHPWYDRLDQVFHRSFRIEPAEAELKLLICRSPAHEAGPDIVERVGNGSHGYVGLNGGGTNFTSVGILDGPKEATFEVLENHLYLKLPPRTQESVFQIQIWTGKDEEQMSRFIESFHNHPPFMNPIVFARGGGESWKEEVELPVRKTGDGDGFAVDSIGVPFKNPYDSEMLIAGLDFFSDGRAAVSTFHGDVWTISGLGEELGQVRWRRFASGIYHGLGLKIVDDVVHVTGRDQITRLKDVDGNGEADFYENFNNQCLITTNFHEFALDLHTDPQGNFYFAKAGPVRKGGRGFEHIVAHHGTLLKVSPDGRDLSVVATGLRAPNGIGVGPEGQLTTGENEGTWEPRCKINWVKPGGFYGVVDLAHRSPPPETYDPPLCWLPKEVDNSGGAQVWLNSDRWGVLKDRLLHLSYGTCSLYLTLPQKVGELRQGGVVRLPVRFMSGTMRARIQPTTGHLYVAGMKGWQTSGVAPGCLERVRLTGAPVLLPLEMAVAKGRMKLRFSVELDKELAEDIESYSVGVWDYVWSRSYGSPEVPVGGGGVPNRNEDGEWGKDVMKQQARKQLEISRATLASDGREVLLEIPGLVPAMQVRTAVNLETLGGAPVRSEIYGTIHQLPETF